MSVWQGKKLKVEVDGSSHGEKISVKISGLKKGLPIDEKKLQSFVDKRRPSGFLSTERKESDKVYLSGIKDGAVKENEIVGTVFNENARSSDYSTVNFLPRPSHADFAAIKKHGGNVDLKGGGKYSGRLTVALSIVGGIAKQQLEKEGIFVNAYLSSVGKTKGMTYKTSPEKVLSLPRTDKLPALSESDEKAFIAEIEKAEKDNNSVGGRIECVVSGLKVPLGDSLFDGFEGGLSNLLFSIPAVKGVEFGDGFDLCEKTGSEANDEYIVKNGEVGTKTNRSGGVLGGITFGEDILFAVAIKPTPSIKKPQQTVNLKTLKEETLELKGRFDPCVAVRAAYVVEAVTNLYIYDLLEEENNA